MNHPTRHDTSGGPGSGSLLWGAGAALLAVLCCAGPVLVAGGAASGVLGAVGAWLASPWVIGLAVALAVVAVAGLVRVLPHVSFSVRPDV